MDGTAETERLVEILSLSDLGSCAQASISFSKISMRDIRVLLSRTSGPAGGGSGDERTKEDEDCVGYH